VTLQPYACPGERRSVVSSSKGSTFPRPPRYSRIRPSRFRASTAERARRDPEAGEREGDRFGRRHQPSPEYGREPAGPALAFARISTATMLRSTRSLFTFRHPRVARSQWRPDDRADLRGAHDRIRPDRSCRLDRGLRSRLQWPRLTAPAMSTRFRIVANGAVMARLLLRGFFGPEEDSPARSMRPATQLRLRETGTELLDAGRSLLARCTGRLGLSLPSTCEAPTQADRRADPSGAALRLWRLAGTGRSASRDPHWCSRGHKRSAVSRLAVSGSSRATDVFSAMARLLLSSCSGRDRRHCRRAK
jgi:hypothetical protein